VDLSNMSGWSWILSKSSLFFISTFVLGQERLLMQVLLCLMATLTAIPGIGPIFDWIGYIVV
jgi:hypothetical protein